MNDTTQPRHASARPYSTPELVADRLIHYVGVSIGVIGAVALVLVTVQTEEARKTLSILPYVVGLIAMLGCSAAYQLAYGSPRRELLRRFDRAAIFLMIAGTYTPFTINSLAGAWSIAMTGAVWGVAIGGAWITLFYPRRFEAALVVLYLSMGWIGLVALKPLLAAVDPQTLILLGVGGIFYSVGTGFHLWRNLPFQNAVWHGFVVIAAGCHYAAVLYGVVLD